MKHPITIEIDDHALSGYTDKHLALCWHVAQANPAPLEDPHAGRLAEKIGREIIRRWLKGIEPELYRHQGYHEYWHWLRQSASYEPGDRDVPYNDPDKGRKFYEGRWVPREPETGEPGEVSS